MSPQPTHSFSRWPLATGLALGLAGLLWHAWSYYFVLDDAFIAFRYARNLSRGFGLVFNPGFEAVEGYSSLSWVLLLAALQRIGFDPEFAGAALGLSATAGLGLLLYRCARREFPRASQPLWSLLPLGLLALTRSVAVWSTGGLETRLFELCVFAAVLCILEEEREFWKPSDRRHWPWAGILLGLASWTRPDGLLIALTAPLGLLFCSAAPRDVRLRWWKNTAFTVLVIAGAAFLLRAWLYGTWLPNTYYAKLDGRTWWDMGLCYIASFALEYGALFWLPPAVYGLVVLRRHGRPLAGAVFASVLLPHLAFVAAVGGDHFEYRPLDLVFPYLYLGVGAGALQLARGPRSNACVCAGLLVIALAIWELPRRTHIEFPADYQPGYPGLADDREALAFPRPERGYLYRVPGLAQLADWHRELLRTTTAHLVGIRQEEHALFARLVSTEADALTRIKRAGLLPHDTHIAVDCVGTIPYRSQLRTLDRLGLTDAEVARSEFVRPERSAHGKYATLELARRRGVDLWAVHPLHLLLRQDDSWFRSRLASALQTREDLAFAEVEAGLFLFAFLPQGTQAAQERFPMLRLESTLDDATVRRVLR